MSAKTKIAGLVVAIMALSVGMVYADNGSADKGSCAKDGGWHHGHEGHMMAKVLNLSETQVKQLKDSKKKQRDAMKSIFEQMKSNREAFDTEIVKAAPDRAKISDIQAQLKTIQGQMVDNHLNSILEIKKILTPEQFAGYMALEKEEKMKKHMMMGHGKFDGHKHWDGKKDADHDSDSD